jgi:hypothetical protein
VKSMLQLRVRRTCGLGAIALLAFPLAAQAADYRAQLSESFNSGLAAARPSIALRATFDNGSGGAPLPTGVLAFAVDTRHLTPSAWASIFAATGGTQLGTVSTDLTGTSALRVLSNGKDASGQYVRAGIDVPPSTAAIIGDDNLVMVIRRTPSGAHLTFVLDLRPAVGKLAAKGADSTLQSISLALRSSIVYGGKSRGITYNPASTTALTNTVTGRACAQAACTTTLPTTSSAGATVHLPKTVTLAAPVTATYGYRYSIGGTGRSGDAVSLESLATAGLLPARGSTMVKPDGTFVIRATLRSLFTDDGDLAMPARGRYAVASVEGGNATVYGIAGQDTHVVLAQPRFVLRRKSGGRLLHFSVRIPGADAHVRVAIKIGSRTLATGYATQSGVFSKTVLKPSERGNLRVVAAVPGADTAISNPTPLSR